MKKLRTIMCVMTISFLGITSSSYAQDKTTVMITGINYSKNSIEIVKPNYEVEKKELDRKEVSLLAALKKEVDS